MMEMSTPYITSVTFLSIDFEDRTRGRIPRIDDDRLETTP